MNKFQKGYLYIDKKISEITYPPNSNFIVLGSERILHYESNICNIHDFNGNIIGGPFWRVSCCNAFNLMTAIGSDKETSFLLDINATTLYSVCNYELASFSDDIVIRTEGINKSSTFSDLFGLTTKTSFRRCISYYNHDCSLFYESLNNTVLYIDDIYSDNDYVLRDCLFGTSIRSFPESSIITYRTSEKEIVAFDKNTKESILILPSQYSIKYINDKFCVLENIDIDKFIVLTITSDGHFSDVFSGRSFQEAFFAKGQLVLVCERYINIYSFDFVLQRKLSINIWKIVDIGFESIQLYNIKLKKYFLFELPSLTQICSHNYKFESLLCKKDSYYLSSIDSADFSFLKSDRVDL